MLTYPDPGSNCFHKKSFLENVRTPEKIHLTPSVMSWEIQCFPLPILISTKVASFLRLVYYRSMLDCAQGRRLLMVRPESTSELQNKVGVEGTVDQGQL